MFKVTTDGDEQMPTLDQDIKCAQDKCNLLSPEKIRKNRVGWREKYGVRVSFLSLKNCKITKGFSVDLSPVVTLIYQFAGESAHF